jgi:hypothetical protein
MLRVLPWAVLGLCAALAVAGCGDDEGDAPGEPASGGDGGVSGSGEGGAGGAGEPAGGAGGAGEQAMAGSGGADARGSCGEARIAALSGGSWDPRFTVPGLSGHDGITPTVYDFALEPDGGVLAVGRFAYHEGKHVTPLVRLLNGQWQPARDTWTLEPPGDGFSALAANDDGVLALATADSFGERDGEVWLDEAGEQRVIASFAGQVRALAWFEGKLYVAGAFELSGGAAGPQHVAVWDGASWAALPGGSPDAPVLELQVSDNELYFAGAFNAIGDVTSTNVAVFDGAAWTALPAVDALAVYALARSEQGELFAGGALGELGAAGGVVQLVGDAWQVVGGGLAQYQTRGVVSDLIAHDGVVDVAGCFSSAGGLAGADGAIVAAGLARWDGEQWQSLNAGSGALSPWFQPGVCGDEGVGALWEMEYQRLAFASDQLFVGGSFAGVDGVQTQSLAVRALDGWLAQGESGLGLGGSLDRVVTGGPRCELYGLGAFTHLAGKSAPGRVARFADGGWHVLTDGLPSDAYCPALDVAPDGTLAVACTTFPELGAARGVVLLANEREELVELELDVALPPLHALLWDSQGKLWLAGGESNGFVASVEGGALSLLSDDFDGPVQLLDVSGDELLVAGTFGNVGEVPAPRIARYREGAWSALGDGLLGQPLAIARDADAVYASSYDDGAGAYLLGAFDGESWRELAGGGSGLAVEDFYSFNRILPVNGGLVLVGTAELQDGSGRGALLWQNGKFSAVGGGGVHAIGVSGVAVAENALWVGGIIAEASSDAELTSSVGIARLSW